jgi:alkylhydroperoxidase family enzyme
LTEEETRSARSGRSEDKLEGAIAALAVQIVQHRGNVTDGELVAAASAGVSEAMTLEIVAHVAMHIFSNYANNLAHTEVDFPRVAI